MITLNSYLESLGIKTRKEKVDFLDHIEKRFIKDFELKYKVVTEKEIHTKMEEKCSIDIYSIKGNEKGIIIKYVSVHDFDKIKEGKLTKKIIETFNYAYMVTDFSSIALIAVCQSGKEENGENLYASYLLPIKPDKKSIVNCMKKIDELVNKEEPTQIIEHQLDEILTPIKELGANIQIILSNYEKLKTRVELLELKKDNPKHFKKESTKTPLDIAIKKVSNEIKIKKEVTKDDRLKEWDNSTTDQQNVLIKLNTFKTEKNKTPKKWSSKTRKEQIEYLQKALKSEEINEFQNYIKEIISSYFLYIKE